MITIFILFFEDCSDKGRTDESTGRAALSALSGSVSFKEPGKIHDVRVARRFHLCFRISQTSNKFELKCPTTLALCGTCQDDETLFFFELDIFGRGIIILAILFFSFVCF